MSQSLKRSDVIGLGFMLCAFFLGAGNIIFPTSAGLQAGTNVFSSIIGFLLTGVGLPLVGVIALAVAGGNLKQMTRFLPEGTGTIATVVLFIVIGPAFATPRTSLVTWELAIKPLFGFVPEQSEEYTYQVVVTSLYFVVAAIVAIFRGRLIDNIGKILTPALFLLLILLACGVVYAPWGTLQAPNGVYAEYPLIKGFLEGYNTMDAFASFMFGSLVIDILRNKGITNVKTTCNYLITAGFIAAIGLSFVYISLFWLGATAGGEQAVTESGSTILSSYVQHLFGKTGIYILAAVVLLACLTTAIGLLSACADYFSKLFSFLKLSYQTWVIIFAVISAFVANVGLKMLIAASVPALYALYPIVITIVILTFIQKLMVHPKVVYRIIMATSLVMGILAALKLYYALVKTDDTTSLLMVPVESWQNFLALASKLPLYQQDMEWVVPVAIAMVVAFIIDRCLPAPQVNQ